MRLALSPFSDHHASEIASWPVEANEARAWAGASTSLPLEPGQFRRWHEDPDVHPYVSHREGTLVAYGELWVDRAENEIELARIIVHPAHRQIGIGRAFVRTLIDQAETFGLNNLFIRVLPGNIHAISCYEAAGFGAVPAADQVMFNQGQPDKYLWLSYSASQGDAKDD